MQYAHAQILVMARAPVAGEAKTRLIPALGAEGAAMLHASLLDRLLGELTRAEIAPVTLCCTPQTTHPFFEYCHERYGVKLQRQHGNGLGERLQYALSDALQSVPRVVVVGCDIPELGAADVASALHSLASGSDAAISPTEDGGYALLALNRISAELFRDIGWGGPEVMAQTRERLRQLGWRWHELRELWDVDRPEDLSRLRGQRSTLA